MSPVGRAGLFVDCYDVRASEREEKTCSLLSSEALDLNKST